MIENKVFFPAIAPMIAPTIPPPKAPTPVHINMFGIVRVNNDNLLQTSPNPAPPPAPTAVPITNPPAAPAPDRTPHS